MAAAVPDDQAGVPAPVASLAAGRPVSLVWAGQAGGLTFEAGTGAGRCFVTWAPAGSSADLAGEADRLSWAGRFHPVPQPLSWGADGSGSWLATSALPGESAVSQRWRAEPAVAVRAIGEGLRALHENLPAAECPFSWQAAQRVTDARERAAAGLLDPAAWHESHRPLGVRRALRLAAAVPPIDRLVVCHGDACAPNTLLTADGGWSGHVGLELLGTADRWADLAVAAWSTEWNYGPGWERLLLDAYGARPDPERMSYYRLLWDLAS